MLHSQVAKALEESGEETAKESRMQKRAEERGHGHSSNVSRGSDGDTGVDEVNSNAL
jgi:hypothetical protein